MWKVVGGGPPWEVYPSKKMWSPIPVSRREPVKLPFLEVTPSSVLERIRKENPKDECQEDRSPFSLWSNDPLELSKTAPPELGYAILPNKYLSAGIGSAHAPTSRGLVTSPISSPVIRRLNALEPLDQTDGLISYRSPSTRSLVPPLRTRKTSRVTRKVFSPHEVPSFEETDETSGNSEGDEEVQEGDREPLRRNRSGRGFRQSADPREDLSPFEKHDLLAQEDVAITVLNVKSSPSAPHDGGEEAEDEGSSTENPETEDEDRLLAGLEDDLVEETQQLSMQGRNSYNHVTRGPSTGHGKFGSSMPFSFNRFPKEKSLFTKPSNGTRRRSERKSKKVEVPKHQFSYDYESDFESEDENMRQPAMNRKNNALRQQERRFTEREAREYRLRQYKELEVRHSGNSLQITGPDQSEGKGRFSMSNQKVSPIPSPEPKRKAIPKSQSHEQNLNKRSIFENKRSRSMERIHDQTKSPFSKSQSQRRIGKTGGSHPAINITSRYNAPIASRRSTPGMGLGRDGPIKSEEDIPTAAFHCGNKNYGSVQGRTFKPFPSGRDAYESAIKLLRSGEWEEQLDGIQSMGRLAAFHPETLEGNIREITALFLKHAKNLRSQVSRAAIQVIMLFFDFLKKAMEQDLDKIVSLLLHKTSDTNKFLKEDCNSALDMVVEVMTPSKAIAAIIQEGIGHKNPQVRTTVARLLAYSAERLTAAGVLSQRDVAEKMLPALARLIQEGSLETRRYAKIAFQRLATQRQFESVLRRYVSSDEMKNIQKFIDSLQQYG